MAAEHFVESVQLRQTEPRLETLLLRPADLAAQFRRKRFPQLGRRGRQRQQDGQFARHDPHGAGSHRLPRPQLQKVHAQLSCQRRRLLGQPLARVRVADRPARVQERQRDQIISEQPTAHACQRQHAAKRAARVAGDEIAALRSERLAQHISPRGAVAEAAPGGPRHERIPGRRVSVVPDDLELRLERRLDGERRVHARATVSAIVPKRNSDSKRPRRASVRASPV